MPLLSLSARHLPLGSGAVAIGGATASGSEIAGAAGGVIAALAAVAALFVGIASNNAKRRREYDNEIRAAEERGETRAEDRLQPALDRAERDMEFWRAEALSRRGGSDPIPTPPSERERSERRRTRPRRDEESED